MLEQSVLKNFQLPFNRKNRKQIINVIIQLYKSKLQLAKTGNVYKRTDPEIFWFLNTSGYKQRLILACLRCKKAFKTFLNWADCFNNYLYDYIDIGQVSDFE